MSVKRWKFIPAGEGRPAHMKKDQTGAYVEKHDYEQLLASHDELKRYLKERADYEYCEGLAECQREPSLGWEQKIKDGRFGKNELKSHSKSSQHLGAHRAYMDALAKAQKVREG